jgi:hypothetical protein
MSSSKYVGIYYGRMFVKVGDGDLWDSLFEDEKGMENAVLDEQCFNDPKFDTQRDGAGKWMGFVVVASDLEGEHALGACVLHIDAIRVPLRPQIADAMMRWKSLRSEVREMYGIDIGEGRLFLTSDERERPLILPSSPLQYLRPKAPPT